MAYLHEPQRRTENARGVTLGDIGKAITALDEVDLEEHLAPLPRSLSLPSPPQTEMCSIAPFPRPPPFPCRQSLHAVASHTF